jgi:AraC family transcriptional regulator
MQRDLSRDQGIRLVGCRELVSAATADTAAMRAEFLRRRKQTVGPVEWHFVQPKLTLFWFRDNFKRLKANMDGRGVDLPLAGNSNLAIIPEGVEFQGGFEVGVGDINACVAIFMIRDQLPEEYRSVVTEPVLGFRHDALARGLAELSKELSIQDNVFPLMADGWMLQALGHMMRVANARTSVGVGHSSSLAPWQLRRAMDFMRAHLSGNISLEQLASTCEVSVSYFARGFKNGTGVPPHRWLIEMRIEKAKDFLLNTKASLAEVAVACGFADQCHLTRTFRRATGDTPGAWRCERTNRSLSDMDLVAVPANLSDWPTDLPERAAHLEGTWCRQIKKPSSFAALPTALSHSALTLKPDSTPRLRAPRDKPGS